MTTESTVVTPHRRPKVAMLVANDVTVDGRVQKSAASVASFGYDTTVIGISLSGEREEGKIADAALIRLPLDFQFRRRRRTPGLSERSRANLSQRLTERSGLADKDEYVLRLRKVKLAQRDLASKKGQLLAADRLSVVRKVDLHLRGRLLTLRRTALNAARERVKNASDRQSVPGGHGSGWRDLVPEMADYELGFGPELDRLDPDVIHAHDVHLLGVAARAKHRAALRGRVIKLVYDAHEFVPGLASVDLAKVAGFTDLEREYIGDADQLITVSPLLAEWLERDHAPAAPVAVVGNMPARAWTVRSTEVPSLRDAAHVSETDPLIVYSGGFNETRGVRTLVEAMPHLPGVHLALVSKLPHPLVQSLLELARTQGTRDRVHPVPFVAPDDVGRFLAQADLGIHPMLHAPNHEVALPNKYFEYLHAGLPIVVSDVQSMAELTRRRGFGEVFEAGDAVGLAEAVRRVLDSRDSYTSRIDESVIDEFSWETESNTLRRVYAELDVGEVQDREERSGLIGITRTDGGGKTETDELVGPEHPAVLIGPLNVAGQAGAWSRALRESADVPARSIEIATGGSAEFLSDQRVTEAEWGNRTWQVEQVSFVRENFTHVLAESGRGVLGTLNGGLFHHDLDMLRSFGIETALALHGSVVRNPRVHAVLEADSPFRDPGNTFTQSVQQVVDRMAGPIGQFDGRVFVTSLDLLDYLPEALWLPPVVDVAFFSGGPRPLDRKLPVVAHTPSSGPIKSSSAIDAICRDLEERGLIEYRRFFGHTPAEMARQVREIDVFVDQCALGAYGVSALEALGAGRVVVGHVADRVREALPLDLPIVEARASELRAVLEKIVSDRDRFVHEAQSGPSFVTAVHGGAIAAEQLRRWILSEDPLFLDDIGERITATSSATI